MIRFSCMYCGRKIRAKSRSGGRRAHCPACGHELLIPNPRGAGTESSSTQAPSDAQEKAEPWDEWSDREIAALLLRKKSVTPENQSRTATKVAMSPLLPRYDELTLFVLSVALLMLAAISPEIRADLPRAMPFLVKLEGVLGLVAAGMVFSLFGIFFKGPKPDWVKWPMLVFAVLVTAGTGIYAGIVAVRNAEGLLMVFPAWNIMNGVLLLLMTYAGALDTECIIDGSAKFLQVVVSLVCVGVLLGVCEYLFKLHWAITYSVCVGYTMSLHHGITSVLGDAPVEPA